MGSWIRTLVLAVAAFAAQWGLFAALWHADAAELNREQAAHIYALAWGQMGPGYPLPERAPEIVLTTQQKMRDIACPETRCQNVPIYGLSVDNVVYIDERLDFAQPFDASILLHEMVHYIQWVRDGRAQDCQEWLEREREAYRIQAHVLDMAHVSSKVVRITARMLRC